MATTAESRSERPIIQIGDLSVRPIRVSDAELIALHANNKKIWQRMSDTFPHPYTLQDAIDFINLAGSEEDKAATGSFDTSKNQGTGPKVPTKYAICLNDEYIGGIGCTWDKGVHVRTAEWGYWLGEVHWGAGIMSKLAPAFANWLFDNFGRLLHLQARVYEGNGASCRVLGKSGMVFCYRAEKFVWKDGAAADVDIFQRVRRER